MNTYKRLLSKVEDYIEINLNRRISLKELSRHVYLSEFHFHRIFKELTSDTLSQFITRIKMERSAMFLTVNHNITITEIAYSYGYCDTSSYCRAFKKHFNCTPKELLLFTASSKKGSFSGKGNNFHNSKGVPKEGGSREENCGLRNFELVSSFV